MKEIKREYGVRWSEFNKKDQLVQKEKTFKTEEARNRFVKKLEQKDNFNSFSGWLG